MTDVGRASVRRTGPFVSALVLTVLPIATHAAQLTDSCQHRASLGGLQAKDAAGNWLPISPVANAREIATVPGKKPTTFYALALSLPNLRQLLGSSECAMALARVANAYYGWAIFDDRDRLLTGLNVRLSTKTTYSGRRGDRVESAVLTLDGDDLLINARWKVFSGTAELFALSDARDRVVPLSQVELTQLEGPIRDVAAELRQSGLAKMKGASATFGQDGNLHLIARGEDEQGKDKEVTIPQRPAAVAQAELRFVWAEYVLHAVNDWPPGPARSDGDFVKYKLPVGPCRILAQISGSGVASTTVAGITRSARWAEWAPPRVLEFEAAADHSYEFRHTFTGVADVQFMVWDRKAKTPVALLKYNLAE